MLEISIIAGILVVIVIVVMIINNKKAGKESQKSAVVDEKVENKSGEHIETKRVEPHIRRNVANKSGNDVTVRIQSRTTSTHNKVNVFHDDATQFYTASTVLNNTSLVDVDRERKHFEKMMATFHKIFDNVRLEDVKNFCKQYKVSGAKRGEHIAGVGITLEVDEDQTCIDANLWLAPYKENEQYCVLPGTIIRATFKILTADNAHTIGEIFRSIMLIMPGNKFEVVDVAIAEKRNGLLVITKTGKLSVPLGGKR
jgi:hypothetical protein